MAISDGITFFDDFRNAAANPQTHLSKIIKPFQEAKKAMPDVPAEDQKAYSLQANQPTVPTSTTTAAASAATQPPSPAIPTLAYGTTGITNPPAQPAVGTNESALLSRQQEHIENNNLREFRDVGAGITAQRGVDGRLSVTNVGTSNITDPNKRGIDDSAAAAARHADDVQNGRTPQQVYERMVRNRMISDLTDPTITDPSVRANAARALGVLGEEQKRSADISNNAIRNGLDKERLGLEGRRVDISMRSEDRFEDKWGIDKTILQGQAADSEMVRGARTELSAALVSGDPAKVEAAKAKAVAAGVKFDKDESPSSSYTPNQAGMPGGMAVTKNPDGSMVLVPVDSKGTPGKPAVIGGKPASPQQEYQAAIARAGGNPEMIAKINERAKANGVIK